MIDVEKLIEAANTRGPDEVKPPAVRLADFCAELADQLRRKAAEKEAKRNKGFKSYGEHIGTAVVELNAVTDALRRYADKAAAADAPPIMCTAVNQLGAACMRTDAGHTAHMYPPVDPTEHKVCGIEDQYVNRGAAGTRPDRCKKPPHGRDQNHEGEHSVWPWQDGMPIEPDPATIAFLKGERDDLGTEPMFSTDADLFDRSQAPGEIRDLSLNTEASVFPIGIENPRIVSGTASGKIVTVELPAESPDAEKVMAGVLEGFSVGDSAPTGFIAWGGPAPLNTPRGDAMQPDPFDNALPETPKREGVWTGGAEPVPADPRPLWLPDASSPGYQPFSVTSIRTTAVRVGEACGLQYRLISRDGVPEVPSWANIGGSTLHACANWIETRIIEGMTPYTITEETARSLWAEQFMAEIHKLEAETPFPRSTWRRANKGAEGEDWWNEVGPLMVRDYSAASERWHAEGWSILPVYDPVQRRPIPAMELEMRTPLLKGELTGHLDQAWYRPDPSAGENGIEIRVRDLKSGRDMPEDDWQLEAYPFELRHRLLTAGVDVSHVTWSAVYYDARNGKDGEVKTPRMDTAEITYRAGSVLRMHETNNYPANPGTTWKAPCYLCPVRYACPIMATRS